MIPKISIIVPSRNEELDIADTIIACLGINYPDKEIIVVDDSTDNTPQIVLEYQSQGVRLIHREQNFNGCCGARNLGMSLACGKILVLLNADARPNPDFLFRILKHYNDGADYVVVKSKVKNTDNIWGFFVNLREESVSEKNPEWSEGFSCRREAALIVGLIPGDFPIPFCRDYFFGVALNNAGYRKIVDFSIEMPHIVPDTFRGFWNNYTWRGTFSSPHAYYFQNKSIYRVILREIFKAIRTLLYSIILIPITIRAYRIIIKTKTSLKKMPQIIYIGFIQDIALTVGNFRGLIALIKVLRKSDH